jgi:competence protein ComEC
MPYPLLFLALALAAGILAATSAVLPAAAALPGLAAFLLGAWVLYFLKKERAAFAFLLAATALFGAGVAVVRDRAYESNALHVLKLDEYADFRGTLARSPSRELDRDIYILKVSHVRSAGAEREVRGNLRLTVPRTADSPPRPDLFVGDEVAVSARIYASREFDNFNAPFYARFLKGRNIHNRAFAKSTLLLERTGRAPTASVFRAASVLRRKLQRRLELSFPGPPPAGISSEGAVLEALLLGDDGRMDESTVLSLQRTGLYHLFAISGAHIAIVSFLFFSLFKLIRVPRRLSYGILIVALVFYALLVEGSPSVLRAVIMTVAFLAGRLFWKDAHILNAIALSAFALLIANPFSLFDVGFQLTFAATLSIILFQPKLMRLLPALPLGIGELAAMSVAATAGVLPILVSDFNRVTFSSLILNFAAVPLVGLVMGLGYAFFPVAFVLPFLARPLAFVLGILVRIFAWVSGLLDPVPFVSYRVPTPPAWVVIGYFTFLLLLLTPRVFRRQKPAALAACAAFFIILVSYPFPPRSSGFKVTVLDVGQGDAVLVEFPGRRKMLVDAGGFPEGRFDVGESVVSPFLWRKGIKRLDWVVLTHPHPDHSGGLPAVVRNFRIGELWEAERSLGSQAYEALDAALDKRVLRRTVGRGFAFRESGVAIEVLNPAPGEAPGEGAPGVNDRSLVLRLTCGGDTFLLAGDIGQEAEAAILEAVPDVRARVLKSPHHGSDTSSSVAFLERVAPEYAVITVGEGNRYGFPRPRVLERYAAAGVRVLRTDMDGAVEFSLDGSALRVRTAAGARNPH